MSGTVRYGSDAICDTLRRLGITHIFGLPGTPSAGLFEALRSAGLRPVVPTHELAATFMAVGHARAKGSPAVVLAVPGPGFAYALPGLAEATLDSVPIILLTQAPRDEAGPRFQLQAIDQRAMAAPIAKRLLDIGSVGEIGEVLGEAYREAMSDEPGVVLVEVRPQVLTERATRDPSPRSIRTSAASRIPLDTIEQVRRRLVSARRPVVLAGQGAARAAPLLRILVDQLRMPIVTTTSGRGVVPEDHHRVLVCDGGRRCVDVVNALFESSDLILALGCKFSHNGSFGFRLRVPADRLVHVDASAAVVGAHYPAAVGVVGDVGELLAALMVGEPALVGAWSDEEVAGWWKRFATARVGAPRGNDRVAATLCHALRQVLPRDGCVIVDSGLHQQWVRRHFTVTHRHGLVLPSDFQSMGFAVPAAIGVKLADPDREVVAITGDGGFLTAGFELLTAIREGIGLTVIVVNDGHYGLIRRQQVTAYGRETGTMLHNPDFRALAHAFGARYTRVEGDPHTALEESIGHGDVVLVEIPLPGDPGLWRRRVAGTGRKALQPSLPAGAVAWLERLLGRPDRG